MLYLYLGRYVLLHHKMKRVGTLNRDDDIFNLPRHKIETIFCLTH